MTDVVKFCTLGTLVKKVIDNFHQVQIEQIKVMQSLYG